MADWIGYAKDVANALVKDGQSMTVVITEQSGAYDIETGMRTTTQTEYPTNGFIKNFEASLSMDPALVDIIFHSGLTPDTLPDLTAKKNVALLSELGDEYFLENIQAVRPTTVTLSYKATGKRS